MCLWNNNPFHQPFSFSKEKEKPHRKTPCVFLFASENQKMVFLGLAEKKKKEGIACNPSIGLFSLVLNLCTGINIILW